MTIPKTNQRPNKKKTINMLSSAYKYKGQGVGSAYEEQVSLVKNNLPDDFEICENKVMLANITHYHTIDYKYYLCMWLVKLRGKTVGYVHMIPETVESSIRLPRPIKNIFYAYMISFYKRMDYLVTVNAYFIDKLVEYGVNRNKITFIPNFVSDTLFYKRSEEDKVMLRRKYDIPVDAFLVVCVGQLQVRKGIFDFIETAKRLPEVQFVWAGGFSFGKITEGYARVIKIMEAPPANVRFLGIVERENMPDIYNMADMMFLPSFEELFPMTVLESMSCHIPMLLRDLDIYEDILQDYYLRTNSVDGFVQTIKRLKDDSSYYLNAALASARGHEFYSKEHVFAMWDAFYRKVSEAGDRKHEKRKGHKNQSR
jgi:1,2-diacylglycerol-3-alpha-glucose alpha-1,2-galactosyltransferase